MNRNDLNEPRETDGDGSGPDNSAGISGAPRVPLIGHAKKWWIAVGFILIVFVALVVG